jgi:hypothetical protein
MLLQLAAQYIGQLTDIELRRVFPAPLPRPRLPGSWVGGDFVPTAWSV